MEKNFEMGIYSVEKHFQDQRQIWHSLCSEKKKNTP